MSVPKIPVMDFTEIEAVINFRRQNRKNKGSNGVLSTEEDLPPPVIDLRKTLLI